MISIVQTGWYSMNASKKASRMLTLAMTTQRYICLCREWFCEHRSRCLCNRDISRPMQWLTFWSCINSSSAKTGLVAKSCNFCSLKIMQRRQYLLSHSIQYLLTEIWVTKRLQCAFVWKKCRFEHTSRECKPHSKQSMKRSFKCSFFFFAVFLFLFALCPSQTVQFQLIYSLQWVIARFLCHSAPLGISVAIAQLIAINLFSFWWTDAIDFWSTLENAWPFHVCLCHSCRRITVWLKAIDSTKPLLWIQV